MMVMMMNLHLRLGHDDALWFEIHLTNIASLAVGTDEERSFDAMRRPFGVDVVDVCIVLVFTDTCDRGFCYQVARRRRLNLVPNGLLHGRLLVTYEADMSRTAFCRLVLHGQEWLLPRIRSVSCHEIELLHTFAR